MKHGGEIYSQELKNKIKQDFSVNINPYPCPGSVYTALKDSFDHIAEYPDAGQTAFRESVAERISNSINADNIVGGNGASELFSAIVSAIKPQRALLLAPSFYGYTHALLREPDCKVTTYPLREYNDFKLAEDFLDAITPDTDIIFLANPNNPTGQSVDPALMLRIVKRTNDLGATLVVDECFLNLSSKGESVKDLVNEFKNLFVVDAYTKLFSIPGVRVGLCISCKENIDRLKTVLPEWNMSVFAQNVGVACAKELAHSDFKKKSVEIIERERAFLINSLLELFPEKVTIYPSDTNFILIRSDLDLYEICLSQGILIRDCSNFEGLGKGYYRIAIKSHEDNKHLITAISHQ
ncbi:pyridoxal phosphate-dependent aminotransferase [Butyrivibrio proteoclasticus]|uniref:pyridoxal phosphate-dependent aminotransferase n=1 Tax=Butyrivibrio proteoclasticus TaxID=43305 RepID=UPI000478950E|nr:histidinol-phosphate transaminase [Butyrivibrio proteoclasticus]